MATARRPTRTDAVARGFPTLLLDVWATNGCGWDAPADDAGDGDQGHNVREGEQQKQCGGPARRDRHVGRVIALELVHERAREAIQHACRERPERAPVPEDQRRERDEAAAVRHLLLESAGK